MGQLHAVGRDSSGYGQVAHLRANIHPYLRTLWIAPGPPIMRSSLMEARAAAKRRGRKSMGTEERLVVAERMKKYWAMRRQANLSTIHKEEYADGMHRSGSSGR